MFFGYLFSIDQVSSDVRKSSPLYSGTLKRVTFKYVLKSVTSEGKEVWGAAVQRTCLLEDSVGGRAHTG